MRFDERYIEELKARLRPSDVIGRTVKLKRQGREYVGLSPFSKEKSPSFFVNDDKGFFHDFSSGKHGDIISFLQETERLSFVEAVQRLAGEAGMALPAEDPQAAEREEKRKGLADWMELAQKWFAANLRRSTGKAVREYLDRRGLPEDQWDRFGLGYAPNDREGLKAALVQRGAKPGDLVEAGLLIAPEGGGTPYDRFRDRLIFPILDARGRIVSFGGRAMNPDDRAKYLNGPESPLFHKGATLYGLPEARRILGAESKSDQAIVVVEGYMDVIACQRAGIPAVAPMGTALTEEQMALLWRVSSEPVLCFDGDGAGQRAAFRAIERALPLLKPGKSFRFALLSGGQDPDDILRDRGAPALRQAIGETQTFVEVLFQKEFAHEPISTPESKAGLKTRLRSAANSIGDKDLAGTYLQDLFGRFREAFSERSSWSGQSWKAPPPPTELIGTLDGVYAVPTTPVGKNYPDKRVVFAKDRALDLFDPTTAAIASCAISRPHLLDDHLEALSNYGFGDRALDGLAQELVRLRLAGVGDDSAALRRRLIASGHETVLQEIEKAAAKSGAPFLNATLNEAEAGAIWTRAFVGVTHLAALEDAVESAKASLSDASGTEALTHLKAERDALKRAIKSGTIWSEGS